MIEALWSVEFANNFGAVATGIAVFSDGRVLGGSSYYYIGGYSMADGNAVSADIAVVHYAGPYSRAFDHLHRFRVRLQGVVQKWRFSASGHILGDPSERVQLRFRWLADISQATRAADLHPALHRRRA